MRKELEALGDYEVTCFDDINVGSRTGKGYQIHLIFNNCYDNGSILKISLSKHNAAWLIDALEAAIELKKL